MRGKDKLKSAKDTKDSISKVETLNCVKEIMIDLQFDSQLKVEKGEAKSTGVSFSSISKDRTIESDSNSKLLQQLQKTVLKKANIRVKPINFMKIIYFI